MKHAFCLFDFIHNFSPQVVAIIPTAQKHRLRVAIQSLDGKVLQEVAMYQTGRPPVVACEPTNIPGEPVVGETAEYPLRLGK